MGSSFQVVAFPSVSAADARELGDVLLDALVEGEVVRPVSRGGALGHPPGRRAHEHTEPGFEYTRGLVNDGVVVETGRTVFDAGQHGLVVRCRACEHEHEPGVAFMRGVQRWAEGEDDVSYACPKCGHAERLVRWDGPTAWAFAHLGLKFWNWPTLLPELVTSLEAQIGHRARIVRGRL